MKAIFNRILVGGVLLLASAGVTFAEPSPDQTNSAISVLSQVAGSFHPQTASTNRKFESARDSVWAHTINITAGQSTVAVPDVSHQSSKQVATASQRLESARNSVWAHTLNFTAGQSTVSIPDPAYYRNK